MEYIQIQKFVNACASFDRSIYKSKLKDAQHQHIQTCYKTISCLYIVHYLLPLTQKIKALKSSTIHEKISFFISY